MRSYAAREGIKASLFYMVLAFVFFAILLGGLYLWNLPKRPSDFHNDALLSGMVGAFLGAILTLLLAYVAWKQIYQVSRTESASFVLDIKKEFFRLETRILVQLLDEDLLEFVPSTPERSGHFRVKQDGLHRLGTPNDDERHVPIPHRYSLYEVDDLLLGHFEDLGLLYRMGIVELEMIYGMFSWYIELAWENGAIRHYIAAERARPDGADIYENFGYIYNACVNYR